MSERAIAMPFYYEDGKRLHYLDAGQGQPVLLLHGLGSCGDDWSQQIAALQGSYRVIAPDFRGHGQSTAPPGPYSMAMLSRDIFALIEHLQLRHIHLVGFSLGGMVAFDMATRRHPSLYSLTVVNSGPHMSLDRFAVRCTYLFRLAAIHLLGMARLGKIISQKLFPLAEQKPLRELFIERMSSMDRRAYCDTLKAITSWSVLEKLDQITLPTLILSADDDYTSVAEKQQYTVQIPNAKLQVIEASRHATPLDQPEKLNQSLQHFFYEIFLEDREPTLTNISV